MIENSATPRKISGAIFDLDGTILDTMTQWNSLGIEYLREQGIEPRPDLLDLVGTMTLRESAQYFHDEYGIEMDVEEIIKSMIHRLRDLYVSRARIKPGAKETLRILKRSGVDTALATATSSELARAGLKLNGVLSFFDGIFSCRDANIGVGKTSPRVFDVARQFLGAPLEETIVAEDALYAVRTAKESGYFVVAVADVSERSRRDQIVSLADVFVEDHAEFCEWLRKNVDSLG